MQQKNNVYLKGNGSTFCLLKQSDSDSEQFVSSQLTFSQFSSICLSGYFVIALSKVGQVWGWGTFPSLILKKQQVLSDPFIKITEISCGWQHALMKAQDSLYGIGSNLYNQIGVTLSGQNQKYYSKMHSNICAGFRQSYVVKNKRLYGRGQSKNYQLGYSTKQKPKQNENWLLISQLQSEINIKKIVCGKKYLIMILQNGKVYGLGANEHNVMNINQSKQQNYVKTVTKLTLCRKDGEQGQLVDDLCSGWTHILALTKKNRVISFGRNNFGQLGREKASQLRQVLLPYKENEPISISCGAQFSFAIINGVLYGWGWNQHKNILNSNNECIFFPQIVKVNQQKVKKVWTGPAITIIETCL